MISVGQRFGRWVVIRRCSAAMDGPRSRPRVTVRCYCGDEARVFTHALQSGRSKGCRSRRCHWRWLGEGMAKGAAARTIEALGSAAIDGAVLATVARSMGEAIAEQAAELMARHELESMGGADAFEVVEAWHTLDLDALALGADDHGR